MSGSEYSIEISRSDWREIISYHKNNYRVGYVIELINLIIGVSHIHPCFCCTLSPIDVMISEINDNEDKLIRRSRCYVCNSKAVILSTTDKVAGVDDFVELLAYILQVNNCGNHLDSSALNLCIWCNIEHTLRTFKVRGLINY